ncbi:MAG: DinB family protein [Terriglobales bacterium]
MNSKEHLLRILTYDHWANRECLSALSAAAPTPPKVLRLMAHTLFAQKLWLERLQQVPQTMAVWPTSTIDDCTALADQMLSAWKNYLTQLPPADLEKEVAYRNSKGESWSSRVEDVITHVLMHSAYHRGQVALEMRAAGLQPAYTDFIHRVRQGFVE